MISDATTHYGSTNHRQALLYRNFKNTSSPAIFLFHVYFRFLNFCVLSVLSWITINTLKSRSSICFKKLRLIYTMKLLFRVIKVDSDNFSNSIHRLLLVIETYCFRCELGIEILWRQKKTLGWVLPDFRRQYVSSSGPYASKLLFRQTDEPCGL